MRNFLPIQLLIIILAIATTTAIAQTNTTTATPTPLPSKAKKKIEHVNLAEYRAKIDGQMNRMAAALAKNGENGEMLACCSKLNLRFDKCIDDVNGRNCFPAEAQKQILCQKEIQKVCAKEMAMAGTAITKNKGNSGDNADIAQRTAIGNGLVTCAKNNGEKLSPICQEQMNKIVNAIAKKQGSSGTKKSTNIGRDEIKN